MLKIARDEYIPEHTAKSYDGKHDRWRGYNPAEYQRVIDDHAKIEAEKRRIKAEELKNEKFDASKTAKADDSESSDSDADNKDDAKYAEGATMIAKFDAKNRVSVRNLRIREDTAKYLRNLDVNSAHYDPKTRTMRANPYADTGADPRTLEYAGDNFVRYGGDVVEIGQRQLFAWDTSNRGEDLHLQADPTLAEMHYKRFQENKETFSETQKTGIVDKYGGQEHLKAPPKELLLAQSEQYVEYSRAGRVVKGMETAVPKSKYVRKTFHP